MRIDLIKNYNPNNHYDCEGNEIEVGDEVVCLFKKNGLSPFLMRGVVKRLTKCLVEIFNEGMFDKDHVMVIKKPTTENKRQQIINKCIKAENAKNEKIRRFKEENHLV